ncbi:hypothetical protein SAMN05421780_101554 [Flexibacter flexilis DSM 6793]|uniref:DUF1320 domain-containing protein n=1 Tax=Flexibacter flexilis DSM 6793 TaxID=927664 RepID=A0A1I1E5F4_9BACT|nr:hypothetical protein [Flexibacter flexilis]SFB80468.1 hypothetical protein SAMN05421780_101554 [Flexibacter flexilis DSM 6793]
MLYYFLTTSDLQAALKQDQFDSIRGDDDNNIIIADTQATTFAIDYLRERFAAEDCFPIISDYDALSEYKAAPADYDRTIYRLNNQIVNYVYFEEKFYKCKQDCSGIDPTNSTYWAEHDPRPARIVDCVTAIAIYKLHTRINPRKIPQLRRDRYDEEREWLAQVLGKEITPDLPRPVVINDSIDYPIWGSNTPQQTLY